MRNIYLYGFGLAILILNKIRHLFTGYKNPREFSVHEIDRAIAYDKHTLAHWLEQLNRYTNGSETIQNKIILELGPGDDLGVAFLAIARGAKQYFALDKHPLAASSPQALYDTLMRDLRKDDPIETKQLDTLSSFSNIKTIVSQNETKTDSAIQYRCENDFDPRVFPQSSVDIVFSQAAFEHFDDLQTLFERLSRIVKPGALLIAEVDLKTHTRFVRDRDPLSIYRYGDFLYNVLKFSGSPNRLRPFEYKNILQKTGWADVEIIPLKTLPEAELSASAPFLAKRFRHKKNEMAILEFMLCARKK